MCRLVFVSPWKGEHFNYLVADIAKAELCLQKAVSLYYAPYYVRFHYGYHIVDIRAPALYPKNQYTDELSADHVQCIRIIEPAFLNCMSDIQIFSQYLLLVQTTLVLLTLVNIITKSKLKMKLLGLDPMT